MKRLRNSLIFIGLCLMVAALTGLAAEGDSGRKVLALSYPEGSTVSVKFGGTFRLPQASGEAKVERKKGSTEIEIELDEMKPASLFGGDLNTYVLWGISPEGQTDNLGEFILEGNRSKLDVTTSLSTFGLVVTAEPHFLVSSPSPFVVLENTRPTKDVGSLMTVSEVPYSGFEGELRADRETLTNLPESKGEVRPHLQAAATAVDLAERAGAGQYAPQEFEQAREALEIAQTASRSGASAEALTLKSHEAVRLAVHAQKTAQDKAYQEALAAERDANMQRLQTLKSSIQQAQTEAERARIETQQKQLQLEMERRAHDQAIANAREASAQAREAELRAERAQRRARDAASEAEAAREASAQAREKMRQALSEVVAIRSTARGLIVNLPDILFDFGKSTLRPEARETLSRVAGILSVSPVYDLRVEGHTDDVGSDEFNQDLSLRRAQSVRSYLIQSGLPAKMIAAEGFGESQPLVPNDSPENRQKNRRVEIVIANTPTSTDLP